MNKLEEELNLALDLLVKNDYYSAYKILFDQLKRNSENDILQAYFTVFAIATGNEDLSTFYMKKIGHEKFKEFISENKNEHLLRLLFSNHSEHKRWDNYRQPRNSNEINRFAVTAPYCKGNVLEVGCANGDFSAFIAMHAENLFGLDIEPVAIELARYKVNKFGLDNCFFTLGDGANLSFPDNFFDTVVLAEVLEHVPDPSPFIAEALRVCKSGGRLIISVPKGYSIPDPSCKNIYKRKFSISY